MNTMSEIISCLFSWVSKRGGVMPRAGRLDRVTWLNLYVQSQQGDRLVISSVLDGNSVIWIVGVPFKEDLTLGIKEVDFDE